MLKKITLLIFILNITSFTSIAQNIDSSLVNELNKKIDLIERENAVIKAKLDAYKENSSDILDTVSLSIAILLGVFAFANIAQLISTYKVGKQKLRAVEINLENKVQNLLETKVRSSTKKFDSYIKDINSDLLKLELMSLETRIESIETYNANVEMLDLAQLLCKAINYHKKTNEEIFIESALDGIITHFKKHTVNEYEKERIYDELIKVSGVFELKVERIKELIKK